jgi:hypothetical protein
MRIFHADESIRKTSYVRHIYRVKKAVLAALLDSDTKTITIFIRRRYNRPQSQFSNQKSIANEKHQPKADRCLAGITETLR